jgi:hypothetical protein
MNESKIKLGFVKLQKALYALEVIATKPLDEDRRNIDATIQRFEFTVELFWGLLKSILESKGVEFNGIRKIYYRKHIEDILLIMKSCGYECLRIEILVDIPMMKTWPILFIREFLLMFQYSKRLI